MALQGKWTKSDIEALATQGVRALRKNAERALDQNVIGWCDEVLRAREQKEKPPPLRERISRRLVDAPANANCPADLSNAVAEVVSVYEELLGRYPARTMQMLKTRGVVGTLEGLMKRPRTQGAVVLVENNRPELLFEAIVVRWAGVFIPEAVSEARKRLVEWGFPKLAN